MCNIKTLSRDWIRRGRLGREGDISSLLFTAANASGIVQDAIAFSLVHRSCCGQFGYL